jgi:hypothetical protein
MNYLISLFINLIKFIPLNGIQINKGKKLTGEKSRNEKILQCL